MLPDVDLLAQWRVSHVVSAFPLYAPGLEFTARIGDVFVYRNARLPDVSVNWDGPNRVTVEVPAGFTGAVYAVAGGRWDSGPDDHAPGLPGRVDAATAPQSAAIAELMKSTIRDRRFLRWDWRFAGDSGRQGVGWQWLKNGISFIGWRST